MENFVSTMQGKIEGTTAVWERYSMRFQLLLQGANLLDNSNRLVTQFIRLMRIYQDQIEDQDSVDCDAITYLNRTNILFTLLLEANRVRQTSTNSLQLEAKPRKRKK